MAEPPKLADPATGADERTAMDKATNVLTEALAASANSTTSHLLVENASLPEEMKRENWSLSHFKGARQLYGKANVHVYLTVDTYSQRKVVIKSYKVRTMSDFQKVQVAREAWFHPQLDHPCLVTVYAAWLESGFVVMAVEYCSYGSLYSVLKRRGLFSEQDTVVRVVYPMLQALLYVHSKGFIHRDIKLENVLMTPIHAKLADLGLIINQQEEQANTALGTYSYMAPEIFSMPSKKHPLQYKDEPTSQSYNEKVDTWAIGVLTYELLSGSTPFTGSSVWETVRAIVAGKANPLPSYVSQEAYSFVRDCLMMEPQERPSIAALLKYPFISRFTKADSDKSSIPSQLAEIPNATFEGREHGGTLDASNWSDILGIVDPQRKDLMLHTGSEASHTGGEPTEQAASTAPGSGPDAVEAEKPAEPPTDAE